MNKRAKAASRIAEFENLTDAEKDAAVAPYESELADEAFGPMSPGARAKWEKFQKRRGRPPVGEGAERITVSIERSVLRRGDAAAEKMGISRSELVARGILAVIAGQRGEKRRGASAAGR